jgi:hypothetical protein
MQIRTKHALCLVVSLLLPIACDGTARPTAPADSVGKPPVVRATLTTFPTGSFYLLAGPDPFHDNVWLVSRDGGERDVTNVRSGLGVPEFSVSRAGLVIEDASSGTPRLELIKTDGARVPFAVNAGESPAICGSGSVSIIEPPSAENKQYELVQTTSIDGEFRSVYAQRRAFADLRCGPGGQLGFISNPFAESKAAPGLLKERSARGWIRTEATKVSNPSALVWSGSAIGIAIANSNGAGEVLLRNGDQRSLAPNVIPLSWSPDGKELLVRSGSMLGVVGVDEAD